MLNVLMNKGKNTSLSDELNYFAQQDNIYIMDNHLAAIWCWEQLDKRYSYTLVHIDAHCDLGYSPSGPFLYRDIDLTKIPITELTSIKQGLHDWSCGYFLWDNYIHLFNDKYPNVLKEFISITQRLGHETEISNVVKEELDIWHLDSPLWYDDETKKILNLDIDYFFKQDYEEKFEIFSDETIEFFSKWLQKHRNSFEQITIALSPECCGSWDKSITMANRILKSLDIHIEI